MCKLNLVLVFLCLLNLVEMRTLYRPNPDDPTAIAFDGPTNYETRKQSENEVDDYDVDIWKLADVRFADEDTDVRKPKAEVSFFFPDQQY
ncbi:unnamed protein product [Arctia plantaginis]|uniref:Uncharacterized protein n=1 Tax=Arctia plantaginis TaxID=874455 RepID=A0A8S1AKC0_ARCPL|nr:unnamed protein product [Arctia plantaginis]